MKKMDYPTGPKDGMSFIGGRYVFTGPQGYRVKPDGNGAGTFKVVSFTVAGERLVYADAQGLSENMAHVIAARLANKG